MEYVKRTKLRLGLQLIIEKNRDTLSVTEVEILMKARQALEDEHVGIFKKYMLPIILRLVLYVPAIFEQLNELLEVIQ